ncbi:hypothetical protein NDK47_25175 [Brevibacillus ruminantium]|uniref:Uncharacterized protein n=1 Tax=Brevibacillus ruminantium TaxID=2950604 RepID=A0ABY4WDU9_9BACL|nr:hypothetical protein [Brevibacillus ruminantium]USG65360.1 hypothetical protein NDK47_25175 [Brevibacillus ruminantium]
MTSFSAQKPVYDDRVKNILRGLVEGKTRDDLAKELGHKNYKTLDIYMKRKNFKWDREKKTYIPAHSRLEKQDLEYAEMTSSKVATIISLFQKEGADARTIAKRLGFSDHRELATYMKAKGYQWSSEKGNYFRVYGQINELEEPSTDTADPVYAKDELEEAFAASTPSRMARMDAAQLERFLPLLEMLDRNRDKLVDLIVPGSESGKVPRYAVPGIFVTKSVHMTNTLDSLVREYSKEKNISQRDIFAVALIEFFRRYGYEREIETLLGSS